MSLQLQPGSIELWLTVGVQIDLEIGPIFWVNNLEPYRQEVYFPLLHLILFVYALIGLMIQLDNDMCLSKN